MPHEKPHNNKNLLYGEMAKPLEKQTMAQLRKTATKKKNRVCGTPSKMKKGEFISFLMKEKGKGVEPKYVLDPSTVMGKFFRRV